MPSTLIRGEVEGSSGDIVNVKVNDDGKLILASGYIELGAVEIQDATTTNRLVIDSNGNITTIPKPPSTIAGGIKTVTTAGTGEALVATTTPAQYVIITALLANTGTIYVGGSDVDKTTMNGISLTVAADKDGVKVPGSCIIPINDANKVWIDSTVNGNGVSFVVV